MSLYTLPNISGGYDTLIVGTTETVPSFTPMLLIFVFGIVFIGGFLAQQRRNGSADAPMWATVASFATLMIALPMTLTEGVIQLDVLSIVIVVTILSGFWLFTSRTRNEV